MIRHHVTLTENNKIVIHDGNNLKRNMPDFIISYDLEIFDTWLFQEFNINLKDVQRNRFLLTCFHFKMGVF